MKRPLPRTPAQWLKEIKLAIADAADAEPFARAIGELITDANLFHLAPVAAHLALDLVDEQEAEAILTYCEDHL